MDAHKIEVCIIKDSINSDDFKELFNKIADIAESYVGSDNYLVRAAFNKASEQSADTIIN